MVLLREDLRMKASWDISYRLEQYEWFQQGESRFALLFLIHLFNFRKDETDNDLLSGHGASQL